MVTQGRQGTMENGRWKACRITKQMAFQNEEIIYLKNKVMFLFFSKESDYPQFLIDLFSQLLHIKNLYGLLAKTDSMWNAEGIQWD